VRFIAEDEMDGPGVRLQKGKAAGKAASQSAHFCFPGSPSSCAVAAVFMASKAKAASVRFIAPLTPRASIGVSGLRTSSSIAKRLRTRAASSANR